VDEQAENRQAAVLRQRGQRGDGIGIGHLSKDSETWSRRKIFLPSRLAEGGLHSSNILAI
jgi:hypothetical protein